MGAVLAQAIGAAQGRVRPVGARSPPNGRREADLDRADDGIAPSFQVLRLLDGEESSIRVLCRLPAPVLASTLLAAARTHTVCVSFVAFESP